MLPWLLRPQNLHRPYSSAPPSCSGLARRAGGSALNRQRSTAQPRKPPDGGFPTSPKAHLTHAISGPRPPSVGQLRDVLGRALANVARRCPPPSLRFGIGNKSPVELDPVAVAKHRVAADTLAENADQRTGDVRPPNPCGNAGALDGFGDGGAFAETDFDFRHGVGQRIDDRDGDFAHAV